MSVDRCHQPWQKAALQVPRKLPRWRVVPRTDRPQQPTWRNHVGAYDFVFDACASSQHLKCLTLIDERIWECLAINVVGSIRSRRVIDVLARLINVLGVLQYLRSDNSPEFVSRAIRD